MYLPATRCCTSWLLLSCKTNCVAEGQVWVASGAPLGSKMTPRPRCRACAWASACELKARNAPPVKLCGVETPMLLRYCCGNQTAYLPAERCGVSWLLVKSCRLIAPPCSGTIELRAERKRLRLDEISDLCG